MKVSIVIPVFNEEKTILKIIRKVEEAKLPTGFTKEIILIDDGSFDKTVNILNDLKKHKVIRHPVNQGKGAAIRTGIENSSGDLVLIQDADLEYDPADFVRLLGLFANKQIKAVYGSRFINYPLRLWGRNKTPMPLHWVANKILTFLTNVLFGHSVTDMETCYKIVRRDILQSLNLTSNRFEIEPEITIKLLKKGIKINEIPIKVNPRSYHEGKKIGWKDGFIALWTLIKYRLVN